MSILVIPALVFGTGPAGTGKTYVYLRTIFELSRKYGFKKFIIVVELRGAYGGAHIRNPCNSLSSKRWS